jgi:hypothetical protein
LPGQRKYGPIGRPDAESHFREEPVEVQRFPAAHPASQGVNGKNPLKFAVSRKFIQRGLAQGAGSNFGIRNIFR